MNADVLSTNAADGIAVITLSSPKRIYFDRVHETVSGKALDRAMEIARRLSSFPSESVACIKRLVRNATETPLAQGLALERNLFLKLCVGEPALARMRSYEDKKITSPSHSIKV
jgi:enoyl-CoA hydratase/carnithine racemase